MHIDAHLKREAKHLYFDKLQKPACTLRSGQVVKIETERADDFIRTLESPVFQTRREVIDAGPNPVTGPIYIEGAEPGDALAVSILEITVCPDGSLAYVAFVPGSSSLMPSFALWPDFKPAMIWCKAEDGMLTFPLKHKELRLPVEPFIGTIGVAPREERRASYWNGQEFVGNTDSPCMALGNTAVLPVNVKGALLSLGDVHARQGQGEVSGCAVECRADVVVRVEVLKPDKAQFFESGQVNGPDFIGSIGCVLNSLESSIRSALYDLAKRLEAFYGFDFLDAYQLLSQTVELEIGQLTPPHYSCVAKLNRKYL